MITPITEDRWKTVRQSVHITADRFAHLIGDAHGQATRHWTTEDVAAHVAAIAQMAASLAGPGLPKELDTLVRETVVDTVAAFNAEMLGRLTERNPVALADRLRGHVRDLLHLTGDRDPAEPVPWLGGSSLPLAGLLAHLLSELLIHGRDIARAAGHPWTFPSQDAALFFDLFLLGLVGHGTGRLFEGTAPPPRPITVEFRSRFTVPVTMTLDPQGLRADQPGLPADARVTFDPAVLNLMLFGRVSRARALATGGVSVRGRRPWLLPAFLRTVRLPSLPSAENGAGEPAIHSPAATAWFPRRPPRVR